MKRPYPFAPLAVMLLEDSKEREVLLAFPPALRSPRTASLRGSEGTRAMALRLRERARRHLREAEA